MMAARPAPYFEEGGFVIYHADCRDILPLLMPSTIDLVLTDPPYGMTANSWDNRLSPDMLAAQLRQFTTVVMTASQPFSSLAVCADLRRFRHEWIWIKDRGSNFLNASREPMKDHESVLVFSDGGWIYNAQRQQRIGGGLERVRSSFTSRWKSENYGVGGEGGRRHGEVMRLPASWQFFKRDTGLHPTQKPLGLMTYLILTYSRPGDLVLDPFAGSGTVLRAAKNTARRAIGIEIEERYCEIAAERLSQSVLPLSAD